MNSKKSKMAMAAMAAVTAVGGVLIAGANRMRSEAVLDNLTRTANTEEPAQTEAATLDNLMHTEETGPAGNHKEPRPYINEMDRKAWLARNQHFVKLWLVRHERDVTDEIIPFLKEPDPNLRERAVRALGRLESAEAEAPLQAILQRQQEARQKRENLKREERIPELPLKLALGRIRARDLKGKAKLDEVAKNVDLASYDQVLQLAQRFGVQIRDKDANTRQEAILSSAMQILLEYIDLLHMMGRQGENIQALGSDRLAVVPGFQMRLKGATMPVEQEIKMILDHATSPQGGIFPESYLLGLGPRAIEMLIQRLQDIQRNPEKYNLGAPQAIGRGYDHLFLGAAMTGDPRVIPLLKQFEKYPDPNVSGYAQQARRLAEMGEAFPDVPA